MSFHQGRSGDVGSSSFKRSRDPIITIPFPSSQDSPPTSPPPSTSGGSSSSSSSTSKQQGQLLPQPAVNKPKLLHYKPFPRNSVNLVTGPTSVGKTRFITHLFNHFPVYFQPPVNRILVVQCNGRMQPI